jgi:thymidine phosphorylase
VLEATDAEAIGRAAASLGAGRMRADDRIDPAVGIVCTPKIGDRIERGSSVGAVHARTSEAAREAAAAVLAAFTVTEGPVSPPPLVLADLG